jgi:hypothetical protein
MEKGTHESKSAYGATKVMKWPGQWFSYFRLPAIAGMTGMTTTPSLFLFRWGFMSLFAQADLRPQSSQSRFTWLQSWATGTQLPTWLQVAARAAVNLVPHCGSAQGKWEEAWMGPTSVMPIMIDTGASCECPVVFAKCLLMQPQS